MKKPKCFSIELANSPETPRRERFLKRQEAKWYVNHATGDIRDDGGVMNDLDYMLVGSDIILRAFGRGGNPNGV